MEYDRNWKENQEFLESVTGIPRLPEKRMKETLDIIGNTFKLTAQKITELRNAINNLKKND